MSFLSGRSRGVQLGAALGLLCAAARIDAATVTLFDSTARVVRASGCEARVVSRSVAREVSGPCGAPLDVPFEDAIAWIERPHEITPYVTDVSAGGTFVLERFVPAGTVTFAGPELTSGQRLWLVAFGGPVGRNVFQHAVASPPRPQQVPAGRVVAVVLDAHDRPLRISPPVRVAYRGTATVQPERPAEGANLIAFIGKPESGGGIGDVEKVWATDADGSHAPAVMVPGADAIVAVWYGLAGLVSVEIESKTLWLPNARVELGARDIGIVREALRPLPDLVVEIRGLDADAPPGSFPKMTLDVLKATGEPDVVRTATLTPRTAHELTALPPAAYDLVLHIGEFEVRTAADLSSGNDARVEIPLQPIAVSGTVYRGRTPVQAEIRFLQRRTPATVRTAADGTYSTTFWRPQRAFVDVLPLDDPARPPFREMVRIASDRQLDFVIPEKRLGVRIFDAESGEPIAAAAISLRSGYVDASGRKAHDVLAFRSTEQPVTDLPPQRPGTAEVNVRAEGYEAAGPLILPIDATEGTAVIDVAMQRAGKTDAAITVRLPGERPAAGAEMAIWSGGSVLPWRGVAGSDGVIRVPDSAAGSLLLVRHRDAASVIVRYASRGSVSRIDLVPSAPPLLLRVTDRHGARVGPQAVRVTFWLGEIRVSGDAAAFLTWSAGLTSTEGSWLARNLPRAPLRVLATNGQALPNVDRGMFDGFASTVEWPWPAAPSVRLAQ